VFTITMRTPGDDIDLAIGLLFSEGQIQTSNDIASFEFEQPNQLVLSYNPDCQPDLTAHQRQLVSHSSCGLCGKTSLQALELKQHHQPDTTANWLDAQKIGQLPDKLRQNQTLFEQTGGVHGAALFDNNYQLLVQKEDVGRHNAVDKIIGHQLQAKNNQGCILLLSGRVSFELVQKAVMAGYAVLIAVGAPSSLAIDAAKRFDITLIGFTKANSFNVYHGHWRINTP